MNSRKKFSKLAGARKSLAAKGLADRKGVVVVPSGMILKDKAMKHSVVVATKQIQILVDGKLITGDEGRKMAKVIIAHPLLLKKGLDDKDLLRIGVPQDTVDKLLEHARSLGMLTPIAEVRPVSPPGRRGFRETRPLGGRLFSGPLNSLMSVQPGRVIRHTGGRIFHGTGLGGFVSSTGGGCNVSNEKKKLRRKLTHGGSGNGPGNNNSLTKVELYRQLAEDYYNRFVSCDLNRIKLKKNAFILEDDDIDEETGFSYETLNPAAFVMSLHILHLALKSEWNKDGSDEERSILLRNYILDNFPEHEQDLLKIEDDVKNMKPEEFIEVHEKSMVKPCPKTAPTDFKEFENLEKYGFTPEFYKSKERQYNLQYILENKIYTMIYETSKRRDRWYWGYVFEALKQAHVLNEKKTVGVKIKNMSYVDFGDAMYVFLKGSKHEKSAGSITTRCYDTSDIENDKERYKTWVDQIICLLKQRDLYLKVE